MIEAAVTFETIINAINPLRLISKIAIFTFPTWILYRFFPSCYTSIKEGLSLKPSNSNELISILKFIFNSLIFTNYILTSLLFILSIAFFVQCIISTVSSLLGWYISKDNDFRETIYRSILRLSIFSAIYIVSIAVYSDLLLNYSFFLKVIYTTNAYWISIFPFSLIIILFLLSIITPVNFLNDDTYD